MIRWNLQGHPNEYIIRIIELIPIEIENLVISVLVTQIFCRQFPQRVATHYWMDQCNFVI